MYLKIKGAILKIKAKFKEETDTRVAWRDGCSQGAVPSARSLDSKVD